MKLCVPTNFDDKLIDAIKDYPAAEVYGKLPMDIIGGGRAAYLLSPVSKEKLYSHIQYADKNNIEFNYLLNASCLNNREFSRSFNKKLNKFLGFLSDSGVKNITVASPFLLKLIKKRFPKFKVKVSVFAFVDNVNRARMWQEAGADTITLESVLVNRDFESLKIIRKNINIELQLLVNNSCSLFCNLSPYHINTQAHASEKKHKMKGFMMDTCFLTCFKRKLETPVNFLRSDWIRPEDLHIYEDLGYDTFKLVERNMPTDIILNRVKAYSERKYDGNLLDLVQNFGRKEDARSYFNKGLFWNFRLFFKPLLLYPHKLIFIRKVLKEAGILSPLKETPVFIDNKSLDGFLDFFANNNCRYINCNECSHCKNFAENSLTIDENYRKVTIENINKILDLIFSGSIWKLM